VTEHVDRLVHEPARLKILAQLYVVESTDFLFLMCRTKLSRGNLSSHLSKLQQAGYVEIVKEFVGKMPHTILNLTEKGRSAVDRYREHMVLMLSDMDFPQSDNRQ